MPVIEESILSRPASMKTFSISSGFTLNFIDPCCRNPSFHLFCAEPITFFPPREISPYDTDWKHKGLPVNTRPFSLLVFISTSSPTPRNAR